MDNKESQKASRIKNWLLSDWFLSDCLRIVIAFSAVAGTVLILLWPKLTQIRNERLLDQYAREDEIKKVERQERLDSYTPDDIFNLFIDNVNSNGVIKYTKVDEKENIFYVYVNSNTNSEEALEAGIELKNLLDSFKCEFDFTRDIQIIGQLEDGRDIWIVK